MLITIQNFFKHINKKIRIYKKKFGIYNFVFSKYIYAKFISNYK